ncbi:hypothetical protein E0500_038100 [Streptomyces sp. KM273126]|nr:hypothetical protein [Streptomyces sp. KM273126]MBA2812983.1 hypothetical protein [Streptomyces sp. KM273126]
MRRRTTAAVCEAATDTRKRDHHPNERLQGIQATQGIQGIQERRPLS